MQEKDESFFKDLGGRIAELRQKAGMTQAELAQKVGAKQQAWATYENATRRLPASLIIPVCEELGVNVEELLGVQPPKRMPGPVSKLQQQFEAIRALPPGDQKFFSEMIERFLHETARSKEVA